MAFQFPNALWGPIPQYEPSTFESVYVYGFPSAFGLEDIRIFFCQRDGLCTCAYVPGHPCVLIRFCTPSVAKRVLNRYHNTIFAEGHRLLVYPANEGLPNITQNPSFGCTPPASQLTMQARTASAFSGNVIQDQRRPPDPMNSYVESTLWQQRCPFYENSGRTRDGTSPKNLKYEHRESPRSDGDSKRRTSRRKESKNARKQRMYTQLQDEFTRRKGKRRDQRSKASTSNTFMESSSADSDEYTDIIDEPSEAKKRAINESKSPVGKSRDQQSKAVTSTNTSEESSPVDSDEYTDILDEPSEAKKRAIDESKSPVGKSRDQRSKAVTSTNTSEESNPVDSDEYTDILAEPSKAKKPAIDESKSSVSGHQFSLEDKLPEATPDLPRESDRTIPVSENTVEEEDILARTSCNETSDVVFSKKSPRTPELKSLKEKDVSDKGKLENDVENENLDDAFLTRYRSLKNEVLSSIKALTCVRDPSFKVPLSAEPSMAETSEANDTFVENKLECTVGSERENGPFLTKECESDVDDTSRNSALVGCSTSVQKSSEQEGPSELVLKKPSVEIGIKELRDILDKAKEIDVKTLEKGCKSPVEIYEKSSTIEYKPEKKTPAAIPGEDTKKKTKESPNNSKKELREKPQGEAKQDSTEGVGTQSNQTREQNKEKFLEILEFKKRQVELEYERESSTILRVVNTLARKDPSLSENLQNAVHQCLVELRDNLAKKLEAEMESV